jgi:eukaryotic-like serine/threonine-protein kinase
MTEHARDAEAIFFAALDKATLEERAAYVEATCEGDPELLRRVRELLGGHEASQGPLDQRPPGLGVTVDLPPLSEQPGTLIGPYKLLQQIGEGGMGTVYMAEQTRPVQRKVALKVIKPGMDTRQVIARFEAERQALAMMDHVNIARVLDAGATESGRPYFVMELVHGVPITRYCDDNNLAPRERLELFVPVCQAIQHAHQKGIIHRDIKPSNVMITLYDGKPMPKVIDFGVAKATEQSLTERTLFTQYGTMLGTLEYMSPEQAEMSALGVDTRCDIYSLGVLLYELLTGNTPLSHKRVREAAYAEILRMIKEEEAQKPSTRLSDSGEALASISAHRHMEPAKLMKLLRGELDWIVMKTLEKDRNRRYQTANGLAADVQHYLSDERVQACPPSRSYRFRKFARRNKRALASLSVLSLAVLVVAGTLGWALRDREAHAQDAARERAARVMAIQVEINTALKEAERWQAQEKWQEAQSAAKRAEGLLAAGGGDEVRVRVQQLRNDLDMVLRLEEIPLLASQQFGKWWDWETADRAYRKTFADYGIDVLSLPVDEAVARIRARPGVAVPLVVALDVWDFCQDPRVPAVRPALIAVVQAADPDQWRQKVRQAIQRRDSAALAALAASPELERQPAASVLVLARALLRTGGLVQAKQILSPAQRRHPDDFWLNTYLAKTLHQIGNSGRDDAASFYDDAISFYRAALAIRPQSCGAHAGLGDALRMRGKEDEAIACYKTAVELDPRVVWSDGALGLAMLDQRKLEGARFRDKNAIDLDPNNVDHDVELGIVLRKQGKLEEAIASYRKAIELDPRNLVAHNNLGNVLLRLVKPDEALAHLDRAVELAPGSDVPWHNRGLVYLDLNQYDNALAAFAKAIELKPDHPQAWASRHSLYVKLKQYDRAVADCSRAIDLRPENAVAWHYRGSAREYLNQKDLAFADYSEAIRLKPDYALALFWRARAYVSRKQYDRAIADYSESIKFRPDYPLAFSGRGMVYAVLKQWDKAIADYSEAIKLKPDYFHAVSWRSQAYAGLGQWDKAIAERTKMLELRPNSATNNKLAWLLVTCPDPKFRDAARAVELGKKAVELSPNMGEYWNTLGLAHYRAGDWAQSIADLERSVSLRNGGDGYDWFILAMAHWQLVHKDEARKWHDQAIAWMDKNQPTNEKLGRFRAEAADLLGLNDK